ncbi:MAG: DUF4412 domain-containing protein [Candidatus Omnitrophica bacterium]|nr:DUF4412 domain-containing protein [Candidatus Omnitrophota bacterium]
MKFKLLLVATLLALGTIFSGIAVAFDFSADTVMKQKGQKTMTGKIFVSGDKSRMEMSKMVVIARMDKKITWMLMPEQNMYMESKLKPGSVPVEKDSAQVEKVLIGKDTVDGKPATKYKMTFTDSKEKNAVYQWFLDANGFPVKTAALDDSWSHEYANIKQGKQPADLFEVPAGYNKFSVPTMPGRN